MKIWAWVTGILGFAVLFLRGSLHKEKAESAQREADIIKSSEKASEKATEALIRGMEDRNDTSDNDSYDFTRD